MKVINLQPHTVVFDGMSLEPSGQIARVKEILKSIPHPLNVLGIPVVVQELSTVSIFKNVSIFKGDSESPFPDQAEDVFYVVSLYTAQALPDRADLLIPVGQLRDAQGRVIGCQGLAVNSKEVKNA